MAGENIVQGAVTDVIIQPTWGTVEGNVDKPNDEENQLNFADILAQLQIYFDRKSDKTHTHDDRYYLKADVDTLLEDLDDAKADVNHNHDGRYYLKTDVDTLLDNKLDISSWKSSSNISYILSGTSDATKANNNISSNIYASACSINDSKSHLITRYETEIATDGKVKSIWYLRNYNTSGGVVGSKGLQMIMDKSGTLTWSVGDSANFRSAIDAAPSSHTHSYLPLSGGTISGMLNVMGGMAMRPTDANRAATGTGGIYQFKATSTMTSNKPPADAHVLGFEWDNTGGWDCQLALATGGGNMYFRGMNSGTWQAWKTVLHSGNYTSYAATASHTHAYLPTAGGTMSGALNFANNTWNKMGDDCYIGDCNFAGCVGLKGINGATGLRFIQRDGTAGGTLSWDGSKFNLSAPLIGYTSGSSWYLARDYCVIRQNHVVDGTWAAVFSCITKNGDWSVGTIPNTDELAFSYVTNTNYTNKNNVSYRYKLPAVSGGSGDRYLMPAYV